MFLETLLSGISDSSKLTLIIIATLPLFWVVSAIYSCWFHPYADIPGPLGARISRLWLAKQVLQGNIDNVQRALHDKYGPIVRIAPNEVSVSDPAALKLIYAVNAGFTKTDFYAPFASHISPNEDLFTQRDEKHHAHRRRLVNALYSLSSVLESERFIDACTATFMSRLEEFVDSGETVDLGLWLQMYAFDVVGELFYGRQFGFMETRSDYEGYIESLDTLMPAVAAASVLPSYVRPFQVLGHLFPQVHKALVCYDNIVIAAKQTVNNRMQLMREGGVKRSDLLDKLFRIAAEKEEFTTADVTTEAWVSMFAGSDTTAIAMRSILYNLMKAPEAYDKVMAEIDAAAAEGRLSDPVKYSEAIQMPYFIACCKEGFRMHPSVGMSMPRHVPPSGVTICGRFFPGGSRVGMSATVIHFDQNIFGQDAKIFNPDRWFRTGAENMDRFMMHFGAGPRTCIGKHISLTEIYKLIPNMLRHYRIELVDPKKELKTLNFWFNKQVGLNVKVTKR
ncbi:cytochrome P450 oxidoreductase [Pochonia chlamydosporia 170]|uniref:Cytochrome P450 oxidoreductase n=1 Tax=Pochonia chlamydosporia 170 TaxID=1380566 RepID=A0A179F5H6_METCM|nr:cytochrome P450 oxidoreductase [Pochonia chlamydosporia 170]OAQ60423.1 cytochrome P450 oxidoreductase [Pochonia chlamydosporia 170]